ncbi:restriction endonuclease subunit S [Vibrio atlanticus]|uniref:restriction endonuclease subunit S n=1 Tax=Vibrio atlanticus TaxID=693153 RepID=UPI0022AF9B90|nr:restriction endonuclease subunit S [Vibrio atlanticus]MCZ4311599.1 restriction endonuclease subunit S [Vibrio atlanticus]
MKDLGVVITGGTPPTKQRQYYGDKVPLIKPTDMVLGQRYIGNTDESLSDVGVAKFKNKLVPANTPCIVTIGTIGKSCLTKELSLVNQAVNCVVVDTKQFDIMYIYYLLQLTIPTVKSLNSGTASGRENVSKSVFENIDVRVIEERSKQVAIGQQLSAYDSLIENNNRRIAILEEMAQSLYREWFVNFCYPGHEDNLDGNPKLVDSPLGQIPEGWVVKTLKDFCSKIGSGATPRGGKGAYKLEGTPLIRSLNIYDSKFTTKDLAFIDDEQAARLKNVVVEPNDVLLNITGASVARCSIVPSAFTPARVNQHVSILRVHSDDISPEYLLYTLISKNGKARLLATAQGGATREALTKSDLENFKIVIPASEVMSSFNSIVGKLVKQKEILFLKNENLKKQRDMLLPKLISGDIEL